MDCVGCLRPVQDSSQECASILHGTKEFQQCLLVGSDEVRLFLLEVGQSNPEWTIPQDVEPEAGGEQVVQIPTSKKRKATHDASQAKHQKKQTVSRPLQRTSSWSSRKPMPHLPQINLPLANDLTHQLELPPRLLRSRSNQS